MTNDNTSRAALEGITTHDLHALAEKFSPEPGWSIPGWLPEDAKRVLITGPSKAGKSWLALELVVALGTGYPFLGQFDLEHVEHVEDKARGEGWMTRIRKPGLAESQKTLYIQQENSLWSMERRARAIAFDRGGETVWDDDLDRPMIEGFDLSNIGLWSFAPIILHDKEHVDKLAEYVNEHEIRNLVGDSTYKLIGPSLNDDFEARQLIRNLDRFIEETDCRLILIHHATLKNSGGGRSTYRGSMGSTYFTDAWPDLDWRIQRTKKHTEVEFSARDYDLETQYVRMVDAGIWEKVDADADREATVKQQKFTLRTYLDGKGWQVKPKNAGWGVEEATHEEIRKHLGWAKGTVSKIMKLIAPLPGQENESPVIESHI